MKGKENGMLKEVLVVEGKMDVVAVRRAVEADCIVTGGFNLSRRTLDDIKKAYERRGIIILTDPDSAGEHIRRFLARRFPEAAHAFIPREEATANDDIGVEQASPESIRHALAKVRTCSMEPQEIFTSADLLLAGLSGAPTAGVRRARLGDGGPVCTRIAKRTRTFGADRAHRHGPQLPEEPQGAPEDLNEEWTWH